MNLEHTVDSTTSRQLLAQPSITFDQVSEAITQKYRDSFNAEMQCQYDELLFVTDETGTEILAAAGFRRSDTPFYLEHYLNAPAEQCLSELYARPIARHQLVETGNFIGMNGPAAFALMHHLLQHLESIGYQHLLLTCTRQLKRTFDGLPIHVLAQAQRHQVSVQENWGRYYQQKPEVITGELAAYDRRFARLIRRQKFICHYANNQGVTHVL